MPKKKRATIGETSENANDDSPIDFEQAVADVESIVAKLESGELGLTDSLQQYEIGIKRLKKCHALLEQAERRVTLLSGVDEDGQFTAESFEVGESHGDSAGGRTVRKSRPRGGSSPVEGSVDDLPGLF